MSTLNRKSKTSIITNGSELSEDFLQFERSTWKEESYDCDEKSEYFGDSTYPTEKNKKSKSKIDSNNTEVFLYIQMQLCKKDSLKDWLLVNADRNYENIYNIFKQIIDAVEYIHNQNLIHRDLKVFFFK